MKTRAHPAPPPFVPREEDIQKCAYFLWQEEGCPPDRDLDFWLRAKERLRHVGHPPPADVRKKCAPLGKKRGARPLEVG